MKMSAQPGPAWIVIRFRPFSAEKLLQRAHSDQKRTGYPGLSVFTAAAHVGETFDAVVHRLINVAAMEGINPEANRDYHHTEAGKLLEAGFKFRKDGYATEPAEHFSVDLEEASTDTVESFLKCFERGRAA